MFDRQLPRFVATVIPKNGWFSHGFATERGRNRGFPMMLKSRFGAYDGRGNAVVANAAAIPTAWKKLGGHDEKKLYVPWLPWSY